MRCNARSVYEAVALAGLVLVGCSGRTVALPQATGQPDVSALDAAPDADAGRRMFSCKTRDDCGRYNGADTCVGGYCCEGFDDGHGHCACGELDGGCPLPYDICCTTMPGPSGAYPSCRAECPSL